MSAKLIEKLRKIQKQAESAKTIGNEEEAQVFAGMLQSLMLRHKIEMSDLDYAEEMKGEPIVEYKPPVEYIPRLGGYYKDLPELEVLKSRSEWREKLASTICSYYSCRILIATGTSQIWFVGHRSNAEMCAYLFLQMALCAEKISDKAAKKMRRDHRSKHGSGNTPAGYRAGFLDGFITGIRNKLEAERAKYYTKDDSQISTSLVRVNKEAQQVESYLEDRFSGKKTKSAQPLKGTAKGGGSIDGYFAGKTLGESINVSSISTKASSERPNAQLEE